MKLINAIIETDDKEKVNEALMAKGLRATVFEIFGAFTHEAKVMFYIAAEDNEVESIVEIFRENCQKRTEKKINSLIFNLVASSSVEVGGASLFITNVDMIKI